MFSCKSRILIRSRIIPGPAIEATFLNVRNVVGHKVVAKGIALIHCDPKLTRLWMHGQAGSISNAGGVDSLPSSIRVELEHIGTIGFRFVIANVRLGADSDI